MATELNLDDYTGPFLGKVGNDEDFSRELLVKLAHCYEDVLVFTYYAWTSVYGKEIGLHEAWDVAGELSRGSLRQVMPMARFVAPRGWDWKDPAYVVPPFECQADDLSKEGLVKLIPVLRDQYLKAQNFWVNEFVARVGEEKGWGLIPPVYKLIAEYQLPKLSKIFKIQPDSVINCIKLANMGIDGSSNYGGEWVIEDPDHVVLNMRRCEVLQRYADEGLYPPDRAWMNCTFEKLISENFFPGCEIDIKLPPPDLKIPAGEPFCVWTYTKE